MTRPYLCLLGSAARVERFGRGQSGTRSAPFASQRRCPQHESGAFQTAIETKSTIYLKVYIQIGSNLSCEHTRLVCDHWEGYWRTVQFSHLSNPFRLRISCKQIRNVLRKSQDKSRSHARQTRVTRASIVTFVYCEPNDRAATLIKFWYKFRDG